MKKILLIIFPLASLKGYSQLNQAVIDSTKYPRLTTFTAQQDHENMKQQLGIKKLRPAQVVMSLHQTMLIMMNQ
jgi:hypothetical protein